uniref:Uncharacterized protein n=1 Tax=Anguilla anguilla TaxID=7936 RepID=A0A0E9WT19_ANGAN
MDMFTSGYSTRASRSTQERPTVSVIHNMISTHTHTHKSSIENYTTLEPLPPPAGQRHEAFRSEWTIVIIFYRNTQYCYLQERKAFFFLYLNTC